MFYKKKREKETPTQMFSCESCEIFKSNYPEEHLPTATLGSGYIPLRGNIPPCRNSVSILLMSSELIGIF